MKFKFRTLPGIVHAAALVCVAGAAGSASAFDAFMRFGDSDKLPAPPQGETLDRQFPGDKGWFPIYQFDHGAANGIDIGSATSGAGAGKAVFNEFNFLKGIDTASPALFRAASQGFSFKTADIVVRQSGLTQGVERAPFYSAILKTVFVKEVHYEGSYEEPTESVKILYGALQWNFTRFDAKGAPITTVSVNWDQVLNKGGSGLGDGVSAPPLSYPPKQAVVSGGTLRIEPSAQPPDPDGVPTINVKSAPGFTGGISVDANGIVQISNAAPIGGPYQITIQAINNLGVPTEASFNLTVTALPPLAATLDIFSRALGQSITIPISTLVANDTTGAIFDGLSAATTTLGGQVVVSGANIVYTPPVPDPGASDSFTYLLRDDSNQHASGNVRIDLSGVNGGSAGNLAVRYIDNGISLELTGTPGGVYTLQTASAVESPWANLGAAITADQNGLADWFDPSPQAPRFYRAYYTPTQ